MRVSLSLSLVYELVILACLYLFFSPSRSYFIQKGANVNAIGGELRSCPIHWAARYRGSGEEGEGGSGSSLGHVNIVQDSHMFVGVFPLPLPQSTRGCVCVGVRKSPPPTQTALGISHHCLGTNNHSFAYWVGYKSKMYSLLGEPEQ